MVCQASGPQPELLFHSTVCPTGSPALGCQSQHKELALVFVPILALNAIIQRNGVPLFYDTASSFNFPALYICWAKNVLGRVSMMQCFVSGKLTGNRTPTFPNSFVGSQGQWLTAVKGQAMAAGFMSSTPGCRIMAGTAREKSRRVTVS